MRTTFFIAAAVVATTASAFDMEFFQGCQSGFFLTKDSQLEDYACPEAYISDEWQRYLDMLKPMQMMAKNMNGGKSFPMVDLIVDKADALAQALSVMSEDYEGGSFCQGLLLSYATSSMIMQAATSLFSTLFFPPQPEEPQQKALPDHPTMRDLLQ